MSAERWADIQGYEGLYKVSDKGRVYSVRNDKILKSSPYGKGHLHISLRCGGTQRTIGVHRLVALAFIPNPEGKPQINHINGFKWDNRVENLEWATNSENQIHSHQVIGNPGSRCKPIVCVETGETFPSTKDAAEKLGLNRSCISLVLSGAIKHTGKNKLHFNFLEV